ncbi:MAG: class I SAM-dependent methyltransferase [Betaproteobacteria bacterium]|nr:class I SAM-dependent methyltransferase [Betaproteobacteria bacterium]
MDINDAPVYRNPPSGGSAPWTATVAGCHALAWQQAQLDHWVADVFGYHAVQLGMPELQALRHNRMPHRWLLSPSACEAHTPGGRDGPVGALPLPVVCAEFHALPFENNSLDLVVMPHTLEASADTHQTLREAERVLRPDGRLLITGFNPASLWGAVGRARALSRRGAGTSALATVHDWVGYWRLRDWLRLLNFEVEGGRFGCYTPPFSGQAWMDRLRWMEPMGDRWWPVLGGLYAVMAIKRVRGMRLVGLSRQGKAVMAPSRKVVTQRHQRTMQADHSLHPARPSGLGRPGEAEGR